MERVAKVAQHVGSKSSFVDELASLAALKRDGMLTEAAPCSAAQEALPTL